MEGRFKGRGYMYIMSDSIEVWQKITKLFKAIILQLKNKLIKKRKTTYCRGTTYDFTRYDLILLFFLIFIEVWLIYDIILASGVQYYNSEYNRLYAI